MKTMHGHPSSEDAYAQVKKSVPAISLATVYKNIHLFVESGVFRKVSMRHARCGGDE
jgi:Fur family transcriptional regulator, peroxide stress response regulator